MIFHSPQCFYSASGEGRLTDHDIESSMATEGLWGTVRGFLADWNAMKLKFNLSKFSFKTRQSAHVWLHWKWLSSTLSQKFYSFTELAPRKAWLMTWYGERKECLCWKNPKHVCHFIQDFLETHLLPLGLLANMQSLYLCVCAVAVGCRKPCFFTSQSACSINPVKCQVSLSLV